MTKDLLDEAEAGNRIVYRCEIPHGLPEKVHYVTKDGEARVIDDAQENFKKAHKTGWETGLRDWLLPPRKNPRIEMQQASFLSVAKKIGSLDAEVMLMRLELVIGREKAESMVKDFMKREGISITRGPLD